MLFYLKLSTINLQRKITYRFQITLQNIEITQK